MTDFHWFPKGPCTITLCSSLCFLRLLYNAYLKNHITALLHLNAQVV